MTHPTEAEDVFELLKQGRTIAIRVYIRARRAKQPRRYSLTVYEVKRPKSRKVLHLDLGAKQTKTLLWAIGGIIKAEKGDNRNVH